MNVMNAFSTIISTYLVLYILGSMYIDLAHTGDEPCKCTGCDKGFINELYKFVDYFTLYCNVLCDIHILIQAICSI